MWYVLMIFGAWLWWAGAAPWWAGLGLMLPGLVGIALLAGAAALLLVATIIDANNKR